eukprot:TRINITY_DN2250_c0_g1_i1.p2 TRINITY_DN2250_c0_g1~~TRINITY_DN2250_c0_g1_i1.p2  ORF type:complete len:211 (-),score=20.31 TRINITY_DN2250_c0_g1_i1:335-967(-)
MKIMAVLKTYVCNPRKQCGQGSGGGQLRQDFFHANELHLYYNMSSLLMKGLQLEQSRGSAYFGVLVTELLLMSHALVVAMSWLGDSIGIGFLEQQFWSTCAIGFSAVLFGLKYILTFGQERVSEVYVPLYGMYRIPTTMYVPTKYLAWVELLIIQLVMPNASFLGHLAGILAGIIHVKITAHFYPVVVRPLEDLLNALDGMIQQLAQQIA